MLENCSYATHSLGGAKLKRLGVTSAVRGEGRTSIAIAMAHIQVIELGRSTLLLDLDLERPALADLFGVPSRPGLTEVMRGDSSIEDAAHGLPDGLHLLTAGSAGGGGPRLAVELLTSSVLDRLQTRFDVIVADLPAIVHSPCGAVLAGAFDQLLLVVRADVTPSKLVRQATASVSVDPVVLLNGTRTHIPGWISRMLGMR
jgi:Mrp family chromosome partitioning ATPase